MIALGGRLVLAGVLTVAAVAKLVDRKTGADSLAAFAIPSRVARPLAIVLPVVELSVAIALLPSSTARAGAIAAATLFAGFTAVVAVTLARGLRPDCGCFGNLQHAPIGPGTLVRNVSFLGLAGAVAVLGSGPSAVGWVTDLSRFEAFALSALVVAVVFGVGNAAFSWQLLRQNGRLLRRLAELEEASGSPRWTGVVPAIGDLAPPLQLRGTDGVEVALEPLLDPEDGLLLVFTDPSCPGCKLVLPQVARAKRAGGSIALVGRGDAVANLAEAQEHGVEEILMQRDREVLAALGIPGLPGAILIDADARVASAPAMGVDAVLDLLRRSARPVVGLVTEASR